MHSYEPVNVTGESKEALPARHLSRRTFFKLSAAGVLTLYARNTLGSDDVAIAQVIPGGTLNPLSVDKWVTPLLVPPAMPRTRKIQVSGGRNIDYYEIAVQQFAQQILPVGYPTTSVWGYGSVSGRTGPAIFNAPSLTIEAKHQTPVRIKWINELMDERGNYLPHLLSVDPTLHWANPAGGVDERDSRPTFTTTPGPYRGPVPIVTHVHGAAGVGDESDGYAEAWFLPAATNLPNDFATEGTWFDFFAAKAAQKFGVTWQPGSATFQYPNTQRPGTVWYHDHTLGMTRLNVYAGPAGFYLIRGGPGDKVVDIRSGTDGSLPGPAPAQGDAAGTKYYEIPLAIQDRSFNRNGSLFYPDSRAFFDGVEGPYIPRTDVSPIWNPEFFGNCIMVNGNTWPFAEVEQRRYRLRLLNGCNSRFLILDFGEIPGVEVWQIGNDGGFLTDPVNLSRRNDNRLLMSPAERADVIVDFTQVQTGQYVLRNVGPDEPFGGGTPGTDFPVADNRTTGRIMQFRVKSAVSEDASTPPKFLRLPSVAHHSGGKVRRLALLEEMSMDFPDAPVEAQLGTVDANPNRGPAGWTMLEWASEVTENPTVGAVEVWEFYNATGDAHPIHIHEVLFQVINRQAVEVEEESASVRVESESSPQPPYPWETGFKDTVISYPETVTRVRMRFEQPGQFVWHCHIVEHEDNEMMRPYRIGPEQPGQPIAEHHREGGT